MKYRGMALIAASLLLVTGCAGQPSAVEKINSVEAINVSAVQTPEFTRVIALANGSAEIIASMGHLNILVGRDIASDAPALESVEVVTSGHQIVAEKILSLKPDLVIIDESSGPSSALKVLEAAGIRITKISEAWQLSQIDRKVSELAQAIGAVDDGKALTAALQISTTEIAKIPTG